MSLVLLATSGEGDKSGPLGLATILVLCVVCYFLFKSMSKHLRKVREEFPQDRPAPALSGGPVTGRDDAGPRDETAGDPTAGDVPAGDVPPGGVPAADAVARTPDADDPAEPA
jgi:hypothetical protein